MSLTAREYVATTSTFVGGSEGAGEQIGLVQS